MKKFVMACLTAGVLAVGVGASAQAQEAPVPYVDEGNTDNGQVADAGGVAGVVAVPGGVAGAGAAQSLPATGSDGVSTTVWMALGLFAVGGSLVGVSQVRRRRDVVAA